MREAVDEGYDASLFFGGAGQVYDSVGNAVIVSFWKAFSAQKELLSDGQLGMFLKEKVGSTMADFYYGWNSGN